MTWLATRSIAALGALSGAVTGGLGAGLVLVVQGGWRSGDIPTPLGAVVGAMLLGGGAGRLFVVGLLRDQRHLISRTRTRDPIPLGDMAIHREGAVMARAIDQLHARITLAELVRSEAVDELETVVEGLRDGVLVVDEQLDTVSMNRAASDLLDVPRRSSIGQSLVVVTRDADIVRVVREAVDGRPVQAIPIDYRRSDRQLTVQVQLVRGRGRALAIVVLQDVTDMRRLESVRRDFVANVSHELRTPLASIRALAETLEAGAMHDGEVGPDFLRRIVVEVDRMTRLVDGLIDLGRLQSGRMSLNREPTFIESIITEVLERLQPQLVAVGLTVKIDAPTLLPPLDIDPVRIDQVLTNLVHNAIKFTPAGGQITVSSRDEVDRMVIEVSDTGVGIGPEEAERVFERFYKSDQSRQSAGTGLGLAISKHIVLAHGGTIGVRSELGVGSTFTVSLPMVS